jgi:hypothetical protein
LATASAKTVLDLTLPNPTTNISLARAATFRGFSILMMATDFCTGSLSSGPELTTAQLQDVECQAYLAGDIDAKLRASDSGLDPCKRPLHCIEQNGCGLTVYPKPPSLPCSPIWFIRDGKKATDSFVIRCIGKVIPE